MEMCTIYSSEQTVEYSGILGQHFGNLCQSNQIKSRHQNDVIYTDFSKTFDKIDYEILLKKI